MGLVQTLLDVAEKVTQKKLVLELQGHVAKLVESQNGNFVLQKAVEVLPPPAMWFLLPELQSWGSPQKLARHKYGCRVLERLIEHFPLPQISPLIEDILGDVIPISREPFGNFVVQHILEHGDSEHRRFIAQALKADVRDAAMHPNACLVLNKALTYAAWADQQDIAAQVINTPGVLVEMAAQKNGFAATLKLFTVATGELLQEAHAQLAADRKRIRGMKHGRALLDTLAGKSLLVDYSGEEYP